jgi:NAD(P)-dependent dehydrogenase (short-subunit alcohol dehydrogenase family)
LCPLDLLVLGAADVLRGRSILVTGAGRGIGRAHAHQLAALGANVVVNDIGADVQGNGTDRGPADDVTDEVRAAGGVALADHHDIATWNGAAAAVNAGVEAFGRLDGLVNNAGSLRSGDLADLQEQDLDALVRVHLKGSFACTIHALRHWKARWDAGDDPRASVVNTFSDAVMISFPRHAAYSAVKAGVVQLTTIGSREAAAFGVRLNAYGPRGLTRQSQATYVNVDIIEDLPHPKSPGNSSPLVAWLLSEESSHVTGQVFQTLGGGIAHCTSWTAGDLVFPPDGRHRFEPHEVGAVLAQHAFGSQPREAGLVDPWNAVTKG